VTPTCLKERQHRGIVYRMCLAKELYDMVVLDRVWRSMYCLPGPVLLLLSFMHVLML